VRDVRAQVLSAPQAVGDQVIFFFDARTNFTTYLTLRSTASSALNVQMLFYTGDFPAPSSQDVSLNPGQLRIVDVGSLRDVGLPSAAGVVIATAVDGSDRPLVTRALAGNFTVANVLVNSAWGAGGAARSAAQQGSEDPPPLGSLIDGTSIRLPAIAPTAADLAAYYNPDDLAPAADGGNQLIFIGFQDVPGETYAATPVNVAWDVQARRNSGATIANTLFNADGIVVSDLASVAGAGVNGASGWIRFTAPVVASPPTRLIYFTETLGTFGTGYLLPDTLIPCCPSS
jgi:hypothetical protein